MKVLGILDQIFDSNRKELKRMQKKVDQILELDSRFAAMSDDELKGQTLILKERLAQGETLDDLLVDAFATVRETGARVLGMKHFPVQLLGGMALHEGNIAEMKTGEGKTLVSTLPAYLNALDGRGVYIVTVNDYLARRDSEWMGKIHEFLGLRVGLVVHGLSFQEKQSAYACDISYGTNNEF
ncbi:MAG: preprotein translocase subunit SecA, partial [Firmicutes bacterium HGW-Firmicutes-6]